MWQAFKQSFSWGLGGSMGTSLGWAIGQWVVKWLRRLLVVLGVVLASAWQHTGFHMPWSSDKPLVIQKSDQMAKPVQHKLSHVISLPVSVVQGEWGTG